MLEDKIPKKVKFKCPRCGGENISEYNNSFDCVKCRCEFEKKDVLACKTKEDLANIMSIEEKMDFLRAFKYPNDSEELFAKKLKRMFK